MSDANLQSAVEESLEDNLSNGVTEYQVGNRRVRRDPQMITAQLDALLKLRGLQSANRGFRPVQIDRPA